MTQGKGVDVIMNSLSLKALRLTWNCIAPFGRFMNMSKRYQGVTHHAAQQRHGQDGHDALAR